MSAWLRAGGKTAVFPVAVSLASEIGNWALALPLARGHVQSPRDRPCREVGSRGVTAEEKEFEQQISKKTEQGVCALVCKIMNFPVEMLISKLGSPE